MKHSSDMGGSLRVSVPLLALAKALILLSMIGMLFVPGCGKKADPFIPSKRVSRVVQSLTAEYLDGQIALGGRLLKPLTRTDGKPGVVKLRVDYSKYGIGHGPCQSCPVDFREHEVILARVSEKGHVTARWQVSEGKGLYLLRLRVIGDDGGLGPPSEVVRIIVQ